VSEEDSKNLDIFYKKNIGSKLSKQYLDMKKSGLSED